MSNNTNAVVKPSYAELLAKIAELEAGQANRGKLTVRINVTNADGTPGKGTVAVYGLGRFPVALYAEQWERLLVPEQVAEILAMCKNPKASRKDRSKQAASTPAANLPVAA